MYKVPCLFLLLNFFGIINAQERITSFQSDIHINKNGTLLVQETIEVFSQQKNIIHGILREFPTVYFYHKILRYGVDFKLLSITYNGKPVPYHIQHVSNGQRIYIGDKNIKISPGKHVYTIIYETNKQLGFFNDFDELYWNVTGNGWKFLIDKVQARIFLPTEISADSIVAMAYTGHQDAQDKNYNYSINNNCIIFTTKSSLRPYESFTFAVSFPKGIIVEPLRYQKFIWFIQDNILIVGLCFLLMLFICGLVVVWRKNSSGLIIPLFYPPSNMMPSVLGFMTAKKFNHLFLSADIIDLAVRGFIDIQYTSKDSYTLQLIDQPAKKIEAYEAKLLKELFKNKKTVTITNKYNATIKKTLEVCSGHVAQETKAYVDEYLNYWYISWIVYIVILIFACMYQQHMISLVIIAGVLLFYSKRFLFIYTTAGRKIQDAIDGFKLYLITAEIERMNIIGTPPIKTPELYEKYLPYAIAMGIEQQWTLQFSSLFKNLADQGHPYQPRWYRGKRFVANNFISGLTYSFSNAVVSASTPPGSSSGSRGSGRSGGGGGGGGGGGW